MGLNKQRGSKTQVLLNRLYKNTSAMVVRSILEVTYHMYNTSVWLCTHAINANVNEK